MLTLAATFPDDDYAQRASQLWTYIDAHIIDHRRGGWNAVGRDSPGFDRKAPKATVWKDPCHEGFALIGAVAACDRLGG